MPPLKPTAAHAAATLLRSAEQLLRPGLRHVQPATANCILLLEYVLPLGCSVHLTPVFQAIRQARPHCVLALATRGIAAHVNRHSPFLDHLILTPDPLTSLASAASSLRSQLQLRGLTPDCVLTGSSDMRTRIGLLAAAACPAWRAGFTVLPALYHLPLHYNWQRSLIGNNLQLAELFGFSASQPSDYPPTRVGFSPADLDAARALLAPVSNGKPVLVVVTQHSVGQKKGWHADRFVQAVRHAHALGYAIAFVGTQAESPAIEALRQQAGVGTSIAGATSVNTLAAVLASSDLALTLDTGTLHVAHAVGLPMVILTPSWQDPNEWLPVHSPTVRILSGPHQPIVAPDYQLDEITAQDAIDAITQLTRLYPPSPAARHARIAAALTQRDLLTTQ